MADIPATGWPPGIKAVTVMLSSGRIQVNVQPRGSDGWHVDHFDAATTSFIEAITQAVRNTYVPPAPPPPPDILDILGL